MNGAEKRKLKRRQFELERKLKWLRRKVDRPIATAGFRTMKSRIVLYRNRVENNEYVFKLDEGVTVGIYTEPNLMYGGAQYVLIIDCNDKTMIARQVGKAGIFPCTFFKKMFLKTQKEYIKHKDIIDREYAGFDKLEAELREIKDRLEEDEISNASNKRLKTIERLFENIDKGKL